MYTEDHHTNAGTTSSKIISTSIRLTKEQAQQLIKQLDELREQYGPLKVFEGDGKLMVSIFTGEGLRKNNFEPLRINIATIDFSTGEVKEIDDISSKGHKLAAKSNWENIKDIIEIFNDSIPFDSDYTLDGYNLDAKDERTENAYVRISEKKFNKERESVVQEKMDKKNKI